jgi:hypothetical protein
MSVINPINVECAICLSSIETDQPTLGHKINETCSHLFHQSCLTQWLESSFTCPVCRISADVFGTSRISADVVDTNNPPRLSQTQEKIAALFSCVALGYGLLIWLKICDEAIHAAMRPWMS